MTRIKKLILSLINFLIKTLIKTKLGKIISEEITHASMEKKQEVLYKNTTLLFTSPNSLNKFRIDTFSTKEPETLEWIDSLIDGSTLWDIGANVGLYSIYAAKSKNCRVFSFEPSVFNLELLTRNIFINDLSNQICVVPIPLCEQLSLNQLNMSSTDWGGALSTFGKDYGQDGKKLINIFNYQLIGLSIDEAVKILNLPQPDYIKMDVDGIEQLILSGAKITLKNVKSIILEVNEDFEEQSIQCKKYLTEAGLNFLEKRHSEIFNYSIYKNSYNQIWVR